MLLELNAELLDLAEQESCIIAELLDLAEQESCIIAESSVVELENVC